MPQGERGAFRVKSASAASASATQAGKGPPAESSSPNDPPSYDDLLGIFFKEYRRQIEGPFMHLYERDKEEFKMMIDRWSARV